jgi:hypothetical protein
MVNLKRIFSTDQQEHAGSFTFRTQLPIEQIRVSLHAALHDCDDIRAQPVIYKINIAQTPADLWLLRSDLMQCIAQVHSQPVATERINNLITVFKGWLPESQLLRT